MIQDTGGESLQLFDDVPPPSNEDFKFLTEEEAKYFAENYKRFLPDSSPIKE
jgi:hypothetical protein